MHILQFPMWGTSATRKPDFVLLEGWAGALEGREQGAGLSVEKARNMSPGCAHKEEKKSEFMDRTQSFTELPSISAKV